MVCARAECVVADTRAILSLGPMPLFFGVYSFFFPEGVVKIYAQLVGHM